MTEARYPLPSHSNQPVQNTVSRLMGGLAPAAGVLLAIASPGGTNQGMVYQATPQPVIQQVELGTRIFRVATGPTFNDSGSGTITLSGSSVDAFSVRPPPFTLQGSTQSSYRAPPAVDAIQAFRESRLVSLPPPRVFVDSGTGTVTLTGSGVESFIPPPTQLSVALGGGGNTSRVTRQVPREIVPDTTSVSIALGALKTGGAFNDTGSGTITLTGSGVESFAVRPPTLMLQHGMSGVYRAPAPADAVQVLRGTRTTSGASPVVFNDTGTGTITLSGSGVESFVPPPPAFSVASGGGTNQGRISRAVTRETVPETATVSKTFGALDTGGRGYAPAVTVAPGLIFAGSSNQNNVVQAVPVLPPIEPRDPQPAAFVYYNAAPPIYNAIVPGSTNQGFQMDKPTPAETPEAPLGSRVIKFTNAKTFNDSASGTIVLSGTSVEAFSTPPPRVTKAGQTQNVTAPAAAFTYDQRLLDSRRLTPPPVGASIFNDSGSGTITLSGSGVESQTHSSTAAGTVTLSGVRSDSFVANDSRAGTITLSGTMTQSQTHSGSGTGTIVISGTATDFWIPPGGFAGGDWRTLMRVGF